MNYKGNLSKMKTDNGSPIQYQLPLSDQRIDLNQLIGKKISLKFNGQINCVDCGKRTKKSYGQGFCFTCLQESPLADPSIIRPELSRAQWGEARDLEWAKEHDLIPHYVYLALSSEIKVGVTRHHQIPTRWIDQGASAAAILCQTPNRHIAGVIESELKKHYTDKTSWMKMLRNETEDLSHLEHEIPKAGEYLHPELQKYLKEETEIMELHYPVIEYPSKIQSLTFDKTPTIEGILRGIKGQYLILDNGVLNIRKHSGYYVEIEF